MRACNTLEAKDDFFLFPFVADPVGRDTQEVLLKRTSPSVNGNGDFLQS